MRPSQKILWQIYVGVLGAVSTMVAQKAVKAAWKVATGDEPPAPNDPRTPLTEAATWALASGVGVGVVQLLTNRYAARAWHGEFGNEVPKPAKVNVKI